MSRRHSLDQVEGNRIKLKKSDSLDITEVMHYVELGFVAGVEGDKVRLSANTADIALTLEEEPSGRPASISDNQEIAAGLPRERLSGGALSTSRQRQY